MPNDARATFSQSFRQSTGTSDLSNKLNTIKQWFGFGKAEQYFKSKKKR
jgi:hypothetical protein